MPFGSFKFKEDEVLPKLAIDPFDTWKTKQNPENATKLLGHLQPTIDKAISAHVGEGSANLRSQARRMALAAARTYDPSYGAKLETHVMNQLQGLKRIARQQNQIIRIPERVSLEQQRLQQGEAELGESLGRDPSTSELADFTGLSHKRIAHLRSIHAPLAEGSLVGESDGEQTQIQPQVQQDTNQAWQELVHGDLNPRDQVIMEHTLGLFGRQQLSNQAIAAKLGVTPGAVSQRKILIQRLLDQQDSNSPF